MIPRLIEPQMLDSALTRLVVLNSIYFKGLWKSRFQLENTKMRNFHLADGTVSKVPMMSQLNVFNMGEPTAPFSTPVSSVPFLTKVRLLSVTHWDFIC